MNRSEWCENDDIFCLYQKSNLGASGVQSVT